LGTHFNIYSYTYSKPHSYTYAYAYANAMHGEMFADAKAQACASSSPVSMFN
jgi:hypothetical protein